MTHLLYDGSFSGFLTAIFIIYDERIAAARLRAAATYQPDAFATVREVTTDEDRAGRVWRGLRRRLSDEAAANFYQSFLSERPERDDYLLAFARRAFQDSRPAEDQLAAPEVLWVAQTGHRVWKEQHRMEAFVRFQQTRDGLFYALIEPDFDVLPLVAPHFRARYADQPWLIYDGHRRYGLHHDPATREVMRVEFAFLETTPRSQPTAEVLSEAEPLYQQLWQTYFRSVNIPTRRNLKLHRRMVPARYWRYLTEKQPTPPQRERLLTGVRHGLSSR